VYYFTVEGKRTSKVLHIRAFRGHMYYKIGYLDI